MQKTTPYITRSLIICTYSKHKYIRELKLKMRWSGHVAHVGDKRMHTELVRRPEGKKPLGRPRCR
jgi:hypothetical protein